jgi:hypothetical protein
MKRNRVSAKSAITNERSSARLFVQCATFLIACAGMGIADRTALAADPGGANSVTSDLSWSIVPSPRKVGAASHLYGVSVLSATQAWAVGDRDTTEASPLIYRWNGTRWKEVAAAPIANSYLQDVVAISANDVWAVGLQDQDDFSPDLSLTQHWNGTAWSIVPSPNPSRDPFYGENYLSGVAAVASNDVWAVGYQQTDKGYSELIIHWDGSAWTLIPPLRGSYRVLTDVVKLSASDIWAVGYQFNFTAGYQGLTMHWNGTQWSDVAVPQLDNGSFYLHAVTAVSSSDIWAVGDQDYPVRPAVIHWDGASWSFVETPDMDLGAGLASFRGIAALATDDVWATGFFRKGFGDDQNLVEHWDGASWTQVTVPNVRNSINQLYGVTPDQAGGLWAVGYFYPTDFINPISTLVIRGAP